MIGKAMSMDRAWLCLSLVVFTILFPGLLNTCTDTYLKALQDVEVDVCANVYRVVDGDTLDAFPVGRVRLADIDAPELSTPEGELAKQALLSILDAYGPLVYLDVDDTYVMDKYNRVVAVAYLRYNSTHVVNVNKWLIDNNFASISDYENEFNPYTWRLYIHLPYDPCTGKIMAIAMLSTTTITTTTTVERTTVITKTYTSISTATKTVVKESWISIELIGIIAVILFAIGYFLGRMVNTRSGLGKLLQP